MYLCGLTPHERRMLKDVSGLHQSRFKKKFIKKEETPMQSELNTNVNHVAENHLSANGLYQKFHASCELSFELTLLEFKNSLAIRNEKERAKEVLKAISEKWTGLKPKKLLAFIKQLEKKVENHVEIDNDQIKQVVFNFTCMTQVNKRIEAIIEDFDNTSRISNRLETDLSIVKWHAEPILKQYNKTEKALALINKHFDTMRERPTEIVKLELALKNDLNALKDIF